MGDGEKKKDSLVKSGKNVCITSHVILSNTEKIGIICGSSACTILYTLIYCFCLYPAWYKVQ